MECLCACVGVVKQGADGDEEAVHDGQTIHVEPRKQPEPRGESENLITYHPMTISQFSTSLVIIKLNNGYGCSRLIQSDRNKER